MSLGFVAWLEVIVLWLVEWDSVREHRKKCILRVEKENGCEFHSKCWYEVPVDFQMEFSHEHLIITAERYGLWKKMCKFLTPGLLLSGVGSLSQP